MEPNKEINIRLSIPTSLSRISWRGWLPSRGNVVFTLVVVFSLFWAQSANALPWAKPAAVAASTGIWPYQGRLANSAGAPVTATVPMIFKLYNVSSAGTALWQEQWASVQVTGGLFNVMLGSLTAIPQSIVSGNNSLWLGIAVGADSEMTPRVQLGSAPFAWTVPDGSITTSKLANGAVTIQKLSSIGIGSSNTFLDAQKVNASMTAPTWTLTLTDQPQDIPGTSVRLFDPLVTQTLLVFITTDMEVNRAVAVGSLVVDGISLENEGNTIYADYDGTSRATVSQTYLVTLDPGTSHTLVIRAYKTSGTSASILGVHTTLTYFRIATEKVLIPIATVQLLNATETPTAP
jgi:hypothetical protein